MSEPKKPKRRFWQLHLSTTVLMMIVAGSSLRFVAPIFEDEGWNLADTVSGLESSWEKSEKNYSFSLGNFEVRPRRSERDSDFDVIDPDGNLLCRFSFQNGGDTPFIFNGDMLYYADYSIDSPGCRLVAIDLKRNRTLWTTALQGLATTDNFEQNHVNMKLRGNNIVIFGDENEGGGQYIETIELERGKTISNRRIDKDAIPDPLWKQLLWALLPWVVVPSMTVAGLSEWILRCRKARKTDERQATGTLVTR